VERCDPVIVLRGEAMRRDRAPGFIDRGEVAGADPRLVRPVVVRASTAGECSPQRVGKRGEPPGQPGAQPVRIVGHAPALRRGQQLVRPLQQGLRVPVPAEVAVQA
jgi:hypothetical protein